MIFLCLLIKIKKDKDPKKELMKNFREETEKNKKQYYETEDENSNGKTKKGFQKKSGKIFNFELMCYLISTRHYYKVQELIEYLQKHGQQKKNQ